MTITPTALVVGQCESLDKAALVWDPIQLDPAVAEADPGIGPRSINPMTESN